MTTAEELFNLARAAAERPLPESTYRVQFHAGFTFRDAAALAPYLRDLGVTHLYASPYLKARPGSTHGYDVVDHRALNPEVGSGEDYEALAAALRENGLGQFLDVVPNHAGVATNENAWWNDVLENGPAARSAAYFDIAWRSSPRPELQDRVLLPVLGAPYGEALESGQLQLHFEGGAFSVSYYERRFPVAPRSYEVILGRDIDELERRLGAESPDLIEYQSVLTAVRNLPDRAETDPARVAERQREKEVVKRRLAELTGRSEAVRQFLDQTVASFNGKPGDPRSFDALDELLGRQCYRLSFWRVASDEINYRRFFDINDLAALSMERQEVFDATHELILRLLAEGKLDGLRIDHPDGLYDPEQYFRRLQRAYLLGLARRASGDLPAGGWKEVEPALLERIESEIGPGRWPLYVVAEKILAVGEDLPPDWAVHGTSGYDFVNAVNGLFVDRSAEGAFTRLYRESVEDYARFSDVVYGSKRLILRLSLASELHVLAQQLDRLAQKGRHSRDFTLRGLTDALLEVIACFPVYRGYVAGGAVHDADRRYVETAVRRARARNPLMSRSLFRFVRDMLLLEYPEGASEADREEQRHFAGKFQQVTSPVMAKGLEDTAFYNYNRLVSLNEVGGDPGKFGRTPEELHAFNRHRQSRWPHSLSPLSTHDTKRSEDVRARINALSEMPEEWRAALKRWAEMNAAHKREVDESAAPDANEEHLIYQTLLGAWPLGEPGAEEYAAFVRRIQDYLVKALHEAKEHSSWVNPNAEYDQAVTEFIGRILDRGGNGAFLDDFKPFQARLSRLGMINALAQTLLKVASPGAPDLYQGTELWDLSLVDPDNRRPVDYPRRRELLAGLDAAGGERREFARSLLDSWQDGRVKLYVNALGLRARRDNAGLFSSGEYLPLPAEGERADHVFAFARRREGRQALAAVPRLTARIAGDAPPLGEAAWQGTRVLLQQADPGLRWRNVFTGEVLAAGESAAGPGLRAAELFGHFPVALLLAERS